MGQPELYKMTDAQVSLVSVPGQRVVRSKHGYKGVEFDKRRQMWRAYIGCRRKENLIRLGYYSSVEEAAQAYDDLAKDRYGCDAFLNFPLNGEKRLIQKPLEGLCAFGHSENDVYVRPDGRRACRKCMNAAMARMNRRKKRRLYV